MQQHSVADFLASTGPLTLYGRRGWGHAMWPRPLSNNSLPLPSALSITSFSRRTVVCTSAWRVYFVLVAGSLACRKDPGAFRSMQRIGKWLDQLGWVPEAQAAPTDDREVSPAS